MESVLSTSAFRAAAVVGAVFLAVAAAVMWFVSWQTNRLMTESVLREISSEVVLLRSRVSRAGLEDAVREIDLRSRTGGVALYYLGRGDEQWLAGNLRAVPMELKSGQPSGVFRYALHGKQDATTGKSGEPARFGVGVVLPVDGGVLVVGRDIEQQRATAWLIRWVSFLSFGLLGLVSLVAGLVMSWSALSRVDQMTRSSRAIMSGDLSQRLPRSFSNDEFDRLAASFNNMLERIEKLMNGLREVSDNIAHDLKTPLNRLRIRAEEALRDPRGAQAQKEGLERTIEAADDLIKTFNALLLIARLEAGAVEDSFETVSVMNVVSDVVELYEPVAGDAGLDLLLDDGIAGDVAIPMNRHLVGQAVANLVDNAIKYTAESHTASRPRTAALVGDKVAPEPAAGVVELGQDGGRVNVQDVRVCVRDGKDTIVISVADRGPGIAAADREHALRRFGRLEKSRTAPGTGLGLSLVSAVASLHGGSVSLHDNRPGLRVDLTLSKVR